MRLLESGYYDEDYPITTVFEKQKILNFFKNILEFEDCFLTGQVSSNGFKVFNGCIVEH